MKYPLLGILILSLSISACNSQNDSRQKLQKEVIAIHDEVMPLMGTFIRHSMLIDSILINFEKVKIENPTIDTIKEREKLSELKLKIESTNNSMNDWMHDLNLDFEQMSNEDIDKYLEVEKSKIEEINKHFKEVEQESKQTLSLYNK